MKKITFLFLFTLNCSYVQAEAPSPVQAPIPASNTQGEIPKALPQIAVPIQETKKTSNAIELIPHRAEYSVKHIKSEGGNVTDVRGRLSVQLMDTGDGWTFEQRSELLVYYATGVSQQYITSIASFESKDGGRYHFTVRTLRNGAEEGIMKGEGYIASSSPGKVIYKEPIPKELTLPVGCLFPLQHLKQSLEAANAGETVFSNKVVFDGSSDTTEPVDVNVVINSIKNPKLVINDPRLLSVDKLWSLQMAIFARGNNNPDPDYEITQDVLPSGIITAMTMGYGEAGFSVKLVLEKVDIFPTSADKTLPQPTQ
ncbi:MAG: cell envelope integrity EipB family protein [Alphaproteobacteria bacterium]|nr:cell envelope integrity EipB family protein [Alphaproteobacteria bacterium]